MKDRRFYHPRGIGARRSDSGVAIAERRPAENRLQINTVIRGAWMAAMLLGVAMLSASSALAQGVARVGGFLLAWAGDELPEAPSAGVRSMNLVFGAGMIIGGIATVVTGMGSTSAGKTSRPPSSGRVICGVLLTIFGLLTLLWDCVARERSRTSMKRHSGRP
jgi:hypothetical protein